MTFKLKDGSGVEHTYDQTKLKLPSTVEGETVVFTEGEVQEEKTVLLTENNADIEIRPDTGFDYLKKAKCQVRVNGGVSVQPITITENGTTTAPDGYAYSPITVNVPPTSGYQLKNAIAFYGSAAQSEEFLEIIDQAAVGTMEKPEDWGFQMFPLGVVLNINSKAVFFWCSTIFNDSADVFLFPGVSQVDGKPVYMELKVSVNSDGTVHIQVTRLELDGENIISQITDKSFIGVATFFAGDSDSNS